MVGLGHQPRNSLRIGGCWYQETNGQRVFGKLFTHEMGKSLRIWTFSESPGCPFTIHGGPMGSTTFLGFPVSGCCHLQRISPDFTFSLQWILTDIPESQQKMSTSTGIFLKKRHWLDILKKRHWLGDRDPSLVLYPTTQPGSSVRVATDPQPSQACNTTPSVFHASPTAVWKLPWAQSSRNWVYNASDYNCLLS